MDQRSRRKQLVSEYRQSGPEAGVYRIVNIITGKMLLGSTPNLGSMRGKLEFSHKTGTVSALDRRLKQDLEAFGVDAFTLEVLEVLETGPEMTPAAIREDLATLEALWREKLDPALLY
jgi:hypothetical protein